MDPPRRPCRRLSQETKKEIPRVKAALTATLTASCCTDGVIFSSATAVLRSATHSAR